MLTFLISIGVTLVASGAVVIGVLYVVDKYQRKSRSERIDREYRLMCDQARKDGFIR